MAPTHSKDAFLWRGNHPLLDFVNTERMLDGDRLDLLDSPRAFADWLGHAGLPGSWSGDGWEILGQAKVFRAAMRRMAQSLAEGREVAAEAAQVINQVLAEQRGHFRVEGDHPPYHRHFLADGKGHPLLSLALSASDLLCSQDLSLVRHCQNEACILFFLDVTRNHTRRWCSMQSCGNRAKVAAHYQRMKAR